MKHWYAWLFLSFALVGCSDSSEPRELEEVTIDTFNVALAGAFIPYEDERRQPIADAIASHDADVLCLQEVWTQADKELIRDAVAENYPHVAVFENDLDRLPDDPTDQEGNVPPTPTTVPCPDVEVLEGVTIEDQMNDAVDCVSENCSTMPGSEDGRTESATCASDSCSLAVAGLLLGNAEQQRCYACVVTQLPTSTFGDIRGSCTTIVNQDLAFNGQNGVMILSKYPLENKGEWVIPGTWNRRTILRATVKLPGGADLDTYCNHLTPIFDDFTFPYTGQYGEGKTGAAGWQAEQELQTEKLVAHVEATSGSRPAVILGDFNAGLTFPDQNIVGEGEPTFERLAGAYTPAYTDDYTPQCTFCSDNLLTGAESDVWIDHVFLHELDADAVIDTERVFDEAVVPIEGVGTVPLSDHYGMRSVIAVP
jgi:endonuclease/exonuclease/phosphatase family metal-dependent hydrolase